MSKHYTAFQYDAAYKPKALRNWEIPKFFCHRPRQRLGRTKIIANATGNILPGVHRLEGSPWGNFVGTWSMPRRIDRSTAAILNGSAEHKIKAERCHHHYTLKPVRPHEEPKEEPIEEPKEKPKTKRKLEDKKMEEAAPMPEVKKEESTEQEEQKQPVKEEVAPKPLCPIHDLVFTAIESR